MIREFSTPSLCGGIGFTTNEFHIGICLIWSCGELSVHLGPLYVWLKLAAE